MIYSVLFVLYVIGFGMFIRSKSWTIFILSPILVWPILGYLIICNLEKYAHRNSGGNL